MRSHCCRPFRRRLRHCFRPASLTICSYAAVVYPGLAAWIVFAGLGRHSHTSASAFLVAQYTAYIVLLEETPHHASAETIKARRATCGGLCLQRVQNLAFAE